MPLGEKCRKFIKAHMKKKNIKSTPLLQGVPINVLGFVLPDYLHVIFTIYGDVEIVMY